MNKQSKVLMTTKTLAYCALLAALSVVLARLFGMMPSESVRFSIEAVPIFLAGMLFGPLPGALVGFAADAVGCLFSQFGYNPIFCIPPILYGLFGGLFRWYLCRRITIPKLLVAMLPPVVLGSILYQSLTLTWMYYKDGPFLQGLMFNLGSRSIQFVITWVVDVLVIYLLCKANIFQRIGIWPKKGKK